MTCSLLFTDQFPSCVHIGFQSWSKNTNLFVETWENIKFYVTKVTKYQTEVRLYTHETKIYHQPIDVTCIPSKRPLSALLMMWTMMPPFSTIHASCFAVSFLGPHALALHPLVYLEDHPMTDGYVVNNPGDGSCPLRIGLWDPFQMAELHAL